jgi:hypothetical protein
MGQGAGAKQRSEVRCQRRVVRSERLGVRRNAKEHEARNDTVDREVSLEERGTETNRFNRCLVLGSTLAFFPGAQSKIAVCRRLQGPGPLPRSGRLASRSLSCVNIRADHLGKRARHGFRT